MTSRTTAAGFVVALVLAAVPLAGWTQGRVTLNVITAGDTNMVDYIKDFLGPQFEKQNPNVAVKAVGTGPGDSGSQKIMEKVYAQRDAGSNAWDVDVAVIHQKFAGEMAQKGALAKYLGQVSTGTMVTSVTAKNALGYDVDGYVIPMFQSQTAIAYNPSVVKNPPKTYDDIITWAQANPRKFCYNGIKGGMSGVAFVTGWMYAYGGNAEKLMSGPYDPNTKASWGPALAKLKD